MCNCKGLKKHLAKNRNESKHKATCLKSKKKRKNKKNGRNKSIKKSI